jgi:hypothetical protein
MFFFASSMLIHNHKYIYYYCIHHYMGSSTESLITMFNKTESIITIVFYQSTNQFFYSNNQKISQRCGSVYMDQISNNRPFNSTYEAQSLFKLGVPNVRQASVSDTDTYDYIELCHFSQIITSANVSVSVSVSCLHSCFIEFNLCL